MQKREARHTKKHPAKKRLRRSKLWRVRTWARTWREERQEWQTRMVLQEKEQGEEMNFEQGVEIEVWVKVMGKGKGPVVVA